MPNPIEYVRRNTNTELVVSTIVAAAVLGGGLLVLRKAGLGRVASVVASGK